MHAAQEKEAAERKRKQDKKKKLKDKKKAPDQHMIGNQPFRKTQNCAAGSESGGAESLRSTDQGQGRKRQPPRIVATAMHCKVRFSSGSCWDAPIEGAQGGAKGGAKGKAACLHDFQGLDALANEVAAFIEAARLGWCAWTHSWHCKQKG